MEWKNVTYDKNNTGIPSQRWGHRMVNTKSNQLVLFGGFGGSSSDGKYLSDIWVFSTTTCTWQAIKTVGQIPQSRSNYTIHYNPVADEIILYGGGSNNKTRYNSVCILDWKNKVWTQYLPQESHEAPWERTYHSSQFCYPYLIVHGGEGVSNIDLDDMWVFNMIDKKWKQISFDASRFTPRKRRFHATALVGNYFYVLGGCTGNYQLLGDVYRVNLSNLFENHSINHFRWECLIRNNKLMERWGHSSNVFGDKIYISCGRISANSDSNDTFTYDPATNSFAIVDLESNAPIARRRHATAIVGNSLLIFGGYNGNYLNDFHYLSLNTVHKVNSNYQKVMIDLQKLEERIAEREKEYECDIVIELAIGNQIVYTMGSNRQKLSSNSLMKNLIQFSKNQKLLIQLPQFCDIISFRLMHLGIIQKEIIFTSTFSINYYASLFLTNEYFVCQQANEALESHLIESIDESNCMQILQLSTLCHFEKAQKAAAETYLHHREESHQNAVNFDKVMEPNTQFQSASPQETNDTKSKESISSISILQQAYEHIKFDLQQKRLKEKNTNFLERAARKIKSVFSKSAKQSKTKNRNDKKENEMQNGCFNRFVTKISSICMGARVHSQAQAS